MKVNWSIVFPVVTKVHSCHEGESKDSGDFTVRSGKLFLRLCIALYINI